MTNLKEKKYFYFTQNSLKTFETCPYRFKKRYIDNVKWDVSNINEYASIFGREFHKIAERYFLGIPVYEENFKEQESLYNAYVNLTKHFPINPKNTYKPEYTIRFTDSDLRLEANMDLLIIKPNNEVEIWDFKTGVDLAKKNNYIKSLQTKVYLYSLKKNIKELLNFDENNYKITMSYFSPENNKEVAHICYDEEKFKADGVYLRSLLKNIFDYDYAKFDKEAYIEKCRYCEFKIFCENQKKYNNEISQEFAFNDVEPIE